MFESIEMAIADPILGLTESFRADANPAKINLGVGVYQDASGTTPVLASVKEAERRILAEEKTKSYLPIDGSAAFAGGVQRLLFGEKSRVMAEFRVATAHTPGGTGALRVAANFLHAHFPKTMVWLSEPTWPNHPKIFAAAGVPTRSYPYFDADRNSLDFAAMLTALDDVAAGDVVLLHGCCHNPTGVDPSPEQWQQIAEKIRARGAVPLIDFAYQGFGDGLREDAVPLDIFCESGSEMLICSSLSKNFGLYRERVGALSVVSADADTTAKVQSQIKAGIRANFSNPPAHGAMIAVTILDDDALRRQWEKELTAMRDRINGMRNLFVQTLAAEGVSRNFSFIAQQRGMFSFSGLIPEQVDRLRDEYSIYIVRSGRINVAGMTEQNMPRLCSAIKSVLQS